jgi:CSLREA domain-containing protein
MGKLIRVGACVAACVVLAGVLGTAAGAASQLTVTTTADQDDGSCGPTLCSLRDALKYSSTGDTVTVPAGTYLLSLGNLVISHDLTVRGSGARGTVIDAQGASRVLTVTAGTVVVSNLRITGGNGVSSVNSGVGGGIYQQAGSLTLDKVSLDHNAAGPSSFTTISGGGMDSNGSSLTITSSTINANTATGDTAVVPASGQFGGGIDTRFGPDPTISDSTIADNTAGGDGGGLAVGGAHLLNDTIARNTATAGTGGGIAGGTTLYVLNTIISENTAAAADGTDCGPSPTAGDAGNNASTSTTCNLTSPGDLQGASVHLSLDSSTTDNGGQLDTIALLAGSAAIDAGSDLGCPAADEIGTPRPQGAHCDIGAFEFQSTPVGTITTGDVTGLRPYYAYLHGSVSGLPTNDVVTVSFDYGPTTAYGFTTAATQPAYQGSHTLTYDWAAFTQPQATYHYRVRVFDGTANQTYFGGDKTWTAPAAPLRGACTNGVTKTTTTYDYELCTAPDLDQVRLNQLPGDGEMFCVPTSLFDLAAYMASGGAPLPPGNTDWSLPANFQAASSGIAHFGSLMGTDAVAGTNGVGFMAGVTGWLASAGPAADGITYQNVVTGVTLDGLAQAAAGGGLILVNIGFYGANGAQLGGHEVFLSGVRGTWGATTATLHLSDPYTSALDDDIQSPYAADEVDAKMQTFGTGSLKRTLPVLQDYAYSTFDAYQAIDGYLVITPQVYASAGPGRVIFTQTRTLVPGVAGTRSILVPGSPVAVALPPSGGALDYVTSKAAVTAGARATESAAAGALVEVNRTTGKAHVLLHGLKHPSALVIGGPLETRWILDGTGVTAVSPAGRKLNHLKLKHAATAALAWDPVLQRLGVLDAAGRRLLLEGPALRSPFVVRLPAKLIPHGTSWDLAFTSNGRPVLHRRGSGQWVVLAAPKARSRSAAAILQRVRVAVHGHSFALDGSDHVILGSKGRWHAFTLSGKPVSLTLPSGPSGTTAIATLDNVDPLGPGQPGPVLDLNLNTQH